MAKRMTDTEKWNGNWFGGLDIKEKLIWLYVCDRCDHAGIFEINERLMTFHLGFKVDKKAIYTLLEGKIYPISESKFFIPAFVEFQCGQLTEDCRPHRPVIKTLNDLNLFPVLESYIKGKGKITLPIPYQKGINTQQDKDKEKDIEQDKDNKSYANDNNIGPFEKELSFIERESFKEIMKTWLQYKKDEHKETYKSKTTLETCYKNLFELSNGDSTIAWQIVNQSIANKWKGLFELKTGFKTKQSANALPSPADKYDV